MKLYTELADWWHLFSSPEDYEEEAGLYMDAMTAASGRDLGSILELGCGGGNNASYWTHLDRVLVDLSPEMIRQSERLNPTATHHVGNMIDVNVGRTFDAVFVHDAIDYLTSVEQIEATASNAARHLERGGVALFVPDHVTENYRDASDIGGHDDASGGRGIRFLEWTHSQTANAYISDYLIAVREGEDVTTIHDRHVMGLFERQVWIDAMSIAGFEVNVVNLDHSELDFEYLGFVGVKT